MLKVGGSGERVKQTGLLLGDRRSCPVVKDFSLLMSPRRYVTLSNDATSVAHFNLLFFNPYPKQARF